MMLKLLRTVYRYRYCLNKKKGTCEEDKGTKRFKSND